MYPHFGLTSATPVIDGQGSLYDGVRVCGQEISLIVDSIAELVRVGADLAVSHGEDLTG